jgi:hypothetical protein
MLVTFNSGSIPDGTQDTVVECLQSSGFHTFWEAGLNVRPFEQTDENESLLSETIDEIQAELPDVEVTQREEANKDLGNSVTYSYSLIIGEDKKDSGHNTTSDDSETTKSIEKQSQSQQDSIVNTATDTETNSESSERSAFDNSDNTGQSGVLSEEMRQKVEKLTNKNNSRLGSTVNRSASRSTPTEVSGNLEGDIEENYPIDIGDEVPDTDENYPPATQLHIVLHHAREFESTHRKKLIERTKKLVSESGFSISNSELFQIETNAFIASETNITRVKLIEATLNEWFPEAEIDCGEVTHESAVETFACEVIQLIDVSK